jgi:hypothetical protein
MQLQRATGPRQRPLAAKVRYRQLCTAVRAQQQASAEYEALKGIKVSESDRTNPAQYGALHPPHPVGCM